MHVSIPDPQIRRTWLQQELEVFESLSAAADWMLVGYILAAAMFKLWSGRILALVVGLVVLVVMKIFFEWLEHKSRAEQPRGPQTPEGTL